MNIHRESFTVDAVSEEYILSDLLVCILYGPVKVEKRKRRFNIIIDILLMSMEFKFKIRNIVYRNIFDMFENFSKIQENLLKSDRFFKFSLLNVKNRYRNCKPFGDVITFPITGNAPPMTSVRYLEDIVTKTISKNNAVYEYSAHLLKDIELRIKHNPLLCTAFENRDIVLVEKGGMTTKKIIKGYIDMLKLTNAYIQGLESEFTKFFPPGDNDTSVWINPNLSTRQFNIYIDEIRKIIKSMFERFVDEVYPGGYNSNIYDLLSSFKKMEVEEDEKKIELELTLGTRRSFTTLVSPDKKNATMKKIGKGRPLFHSYNNTLEFTGNNRIISFELFRIKAAYSLSTNGTKLPGVFSAEFLDISIPRQNDTKLHTYFNKKGVRKELLAEYCI